MRAGHINIAILYVTCTYAMAYVGFFKGGGGLKLITKLSKNIFGRYFILLFFVSKYDLIIFQKSNCVSILICDIVLERIVEGPVIFEYAKKIHFKIFLQG